ncbi:UPF0016-domain-containing protein [Trichodelitschia bisporula]|uniref:UPF0016-domain-containing protein n=1 Tax=Trichodelitschia bisporula TaxID=703511 RepID=A0A6G1HQG4_9PEZI|nr:UPF0016-domain-containing protein [Trichodelitschia bisporula]
MRFRRRPYVPLLLLLLPALTASLTIEGDKLKPDLLKPTKTAAARLSAPSSASGSKYEIGTKDAPVDGLDGKPHAGPFVGSEGKKKPSNAVEDLGGVKKPVAGSSRERVLKDKWEVPPHDIPDSVMDDRDRDAPKRGPTGTEGGVSEKDRDRKAKEKEAGGKIEKKPDAPKEAPPLPVSEEAKLRKGKGKGRNEKVVSNEEKPADLPDKPHNIPHPNPDTAPAVKHPSTHDDDDEQSDDEGEEPEGIIQPLHSLILSFTMIIFSEIGDKTFLVAALMAMRHPRLVVFSAAFSALITMTVLSAILGHAVPTLLPKRLTNFAAAILFLVFGAKLMREGLAMSPDEGVGEEMKEVEMELEEKEHLAARASRRLSDVSPFALEAGRARRSRSDSRLPAPRSPSESPVRGARTPAAGTLAGLNNLLSLLLSPAWVQTFIMTFLGEWGDRSQIATIAMAAGQDYWWVTGGAIIGHGMCTAGAVIGGRAIAGRVSMRVVTLGGAVAFLIFGVIYLAEAAYSA